jgi:UDP-N-acetylglucosamine--N-acetylmuramyl-(pentapeptide) pyrophosphoryl-undecaprenol N-acetylglucosamine transferase
MTRAVDRSAALRVAVVPFIDRMDRAYAIADLVVGRAGGSVAEVTACGLPSILVPYPYATENHQEANARELVDAGAARMLPDRALSSSTLTAAILDLVDEPAAMATMRGAALAWARPDAAARIADLCAEVAGARG